MENHSANRRLNLIASHFAVSDDAVSATHVLPMKCSSSLNSVTSRGDNRMYFARQGSSSVTFFMKQAPVEQKCSGDLSSGNSNNVISRGDNRMYFARQGSSSQACFMRQMSLDQSTLAKPGEPILCSGSAESGSGNVLEAPLFSRPANMVPNYSDVQAKQHFNSSVTDSPMYARPYNMIDEKQLDSDKGKHPFQSNGNKWSPRMDVAETGGGYVAVFELPGAGIKDIRVEVNDQNLVVMSKRSTQWWKVNTREISQGQNQVVLPLPADVNKDTISAELVNGVLQITIPKL